MAGRNDGMGLMELYLVGTVKRNENGKTDSVHLGRGMREEPVAARCSAGASCWERMIVINVKMLQGD